MEMTAESGSIKPHVILPKWEFVENLVPGCQNNQNSINYPSDLENNLQSLRYQIR